MKKTSALVLSLMTLPIYAQSILGTLTQHQNSLEKPGTTKPGTNSSEVRSSTISSSTGGGRCEENDQTSLPLAYVTSLIQDKDGHLDVSFNPRSGTLSVAAPDMISNCNSMLDWKLKTGEVSGKKTYSVEVKFKTSGECSDEGCKYKVAKVENGTFIEHQVLTLKPTLKGFEECLQKSGVIKDNKVVPGAIYSAPLAEKFKGIEESGNLLFVSRGPSTAQVKAKYGKFELIDRCDYYEAIHPQVKQLLSLADEERLRLDAEASKLKDCPINEYHKVSDFIEKYEAYASQLGQVRDKLILEATKKAAQAIQDGKYTDEDLKVIADFDKYIVQPKLELAKMLYDEMINLEGDARKAKTQELKAVLAELAAFNNKPYFLASHTKKLIADGKFDEAERMNTLKLTLDNYRNLGSKVNNVVITPEVANSRVTNARSSFANELALEREKYEIRTGQSSGQAQFYANLHSQMKRNIEVRTRNFTEEIQAEFSRIQPGGYCYAYFRNTQRCIQDSMERIQELQNFLTHYNKIDNERALQYEAKAKEYGKLEAEGRRYLAAQNGEELPPEQPSERPVDTTMPAPRTDNNGQNGIYGFNWNGGGQQQGGQQMQMPFMQQQPGMMGYQPPMGGWGQQWAQSPAFGQNPGYGYGGSYNFNWGGQQQMGGWGQQQQMWGQPQMGYWGQPYSAYNMYSMYGR